MAESFFFKIATKWSSLEIIDDKSTLIHARAWYHQTKDYYSSLWRSGSIIKYYLRRYPFTPFKDTHLHISLLPSPIVKSLSASRTVYGFLPVYLSVYLSHVSFHSWLSHTLVYNMNICVSLYIYIYTMIQVFILTQHVMWRLGPCMELYNS